MDIFQEHGESIVTAALAAFGGLIVSAWGAGRRYQHLEDRITAEATLNREFRDEMRTALRDLHTERKP